jgi:hypothetical protein
MDFQIQCIVQQPMFMVLVKHTCKDNERNDQPQFEPNSMLIVYRPNQ